MTGPQVPRPLYLQAGPLGRQVGASSHSSQLYGGHGAADVQVFARRPRGLHLRDAVGAPHRLGRVLERRKRHDGVNHSVRADEGSRVRPLRRYLPAGDVDGCHDVGGVGVEAPDAAGHGRAHQVLVDVQFHQFGRAAFQHLRWGGGKKGCLTGGG